MASVNHSCLFPVNQKHATNESKSNTHSLQQCSVTGCSYDNCIIQDVG